MKIQLNAGEAYFTLKPENRRYLSGIKTSDGLVFLCADEQVFVTDFRYQTMAEQKLSKDFRLIIHKDGLLNELAELCRQHQIETLFFEENDLVCAVYFKLKELLPGVALVPNEKLVLDLRRSKTADELDKIRKAQAITDKAFAALLKSGLRGYTEIEICNRLNQFMMDFGADGLAFDTIIASGPHGAEPHAVPRDRVVQDGDFVVMDFGAKYAGYCSDMTRTVAVGHVTEEQRKVYNTVLAAQAAGIAAVHGNVLGVEVDKAARDVIADAGYGAYFGHSTGHGVGLEIHEAPNFSPKYDKPVEVGAVMSVEPGIYLPEKFGVRIEDLVIVTENGCEDITNSPKELYIAD